MDERPTSPATQERSVNTSLHLSNGPSLRRTPSCRPHSAASPDGNGSSPQYYFYHHNTLTIIKDKQGYGMKVSGDNPVYVQSVKEGGPAEKAGLHSGDKIIKVNGTDVTHFTHTKVVDLIKACLEVELTVEQRVLRNTRQPPPVPSNCAANNRCSSPMPKPMSPTATSPTGTNSSVNPPRPLIHHHSAPARDRITAPQPVDLEKRRQLEFQREQTFRLMLEREQCYIEGLRSELAKCTDSSNEQEISGNLMCAERRIQTLQEKLHDITSNSSNFNTSSSASNNGLSDAQLLSTPPPPPPLSTLPSRLAAHTSPSDSPFNHVSNSTDIAPPLPSRNRSLTSPVLVIPLKYESPPPLPPRQYPHSPINNVDGNQDSIVNTTVSTDLSSPSSPVPIHHQRTKSNPDRINNMSMSLPAEENTSGSLCDLRSVKRSKGGVAWNVDSPFACTPPGTPPPPYHGTPQHNKENSVPSPPVPPPPDETDESNKDGSPRGPSMSTDLSSPNSTLGATIISMEDDDMSDQDISQLGDLGPFKSLSKLWEHNIHLAVFLNYVLSNCDPSSILFYLVTDLYKEGNGKEMRKWAYEIHSSFLGPGAPLRLNNVDENIAREIDDVLLNESDKEEILRKVFWKARQRAKEELNDQLADFQLKKTAGLGTMYGPNDTVLDECIHDKNKELKMIEHYLVPKMEPYIEDIDKEVVDDRKFTTAAALGTILSKVFGIRGQHFNTLLERCPTFVSKEKSFKARLIIGKSRKIAVRGHQLVAHQYFTVTYCNHCQLIIRGIGPQGYQCTNCLLNIHRGACVKGLDENCPGPVLKKEKTNDRISKLMDRIRPERADTRRKPSSLNLAQIEKIRRQAEDEGSLTDNDSGEKSTGGLKGRANNNTNNVADSVKESDEKQTNKQFLDSESNFLPNLTPPHNLPHRCKPSGTSINRSESYKERIHQKRPIRDRRKTSDPNLSKTNTDVEIDTNAQFPYPTTNSGSSSNSNLSSSRSLDSPSNSLEVVGSNNKGSCENTTVPVPSNFSSASGNPTCPANKSSAWNSDSEGDADPPDVIESVPPEALRSLSPLERKRQEVINELFHTERSHVGALKVLNKLFYKPMKEQQILPDDYLQLLFPNLEQILTIHLQFNSLMEAKKKENPVVGDVGDILLKTFDGNEGETFKTAAATFCCRQKVALEMFKEKRSKKDSALFNFLRDAECHPKCRRLQLQDILPTEMQRLTKYPLLFENLAKYSKNNPEEEKCVRRAFECSREIVNRIDEAVKEAADIDQLTEIQKKLDKSAFDKSDHPVTAEVRNLDLTKRKVIYQGSLSWRIANKTKLVELHVLLLEDIIILLQKVHEKYLLQFFNTNSGTNERGHVFSPVIRMSTVLVRPNAVDKRALYLVDTSPVGGQIYDLVAPNFNEKKEWFRRISDAAEAHKAKEGKQRNSRSSDVSNASTQDLDSCANGSESSAKTKENESSNANNDNANRQPQDEAAITGHGAESAAKKSGSGGSGGTSPGLRKKRTIPTEPPRLTTEVPLIEPSQVSISQSAVLTAEPVLTPLERLRRKDETIKEALLEKQKLVADILHVPKDEFDTIADLAAEPAYDKEASELVLAAVNQTDLLTSLLNECLRVTEEDAIAAGCEVGVGGGAGKPSGVGGSLRAFPGVPVSKLRPITQSLSNHLTVLLTLMTERDEERERLRQELQRSREQLHAMHETQQRLQRISDQTSSPNETAQNSSTENASEDASKACP